MSTGASSGNCLLLANFRCGTARVRQGASTTRRRAPAPGAANSLALSPSAAIPAAVDSAVRPFTAIRAPGHSTAGGRCGRIGEPPWNVPKYHPEEIAELYLGRAMTMADKDDMVSKAKALNPEISIFHMGRDADTKLTFNRI